MLQIQLGTATDHLFQSRIKLVVDPSYNFWSLRFTLRLLQITKIFTSLSCKVFSPYKPDLVLDSQFLLVKRLRVPCQRKYTGKQQKIDVINMQCR